jgi:hypothetical protein
MIIKQYDYLGLHLNNRFAYLQHQNSKLRQPSTLDRSNKYLLLLIFSILTIILIGITVLFVSLIRRKTLKQKESLKKSNIISTTNNPKGNLHVTNCCDYNDSTLLMLNKDLFNSSAIINDNCCLLETPSEKDSYDQLKNKMTYSSWLLSTSNRSESRHNDSSTFNHLSSNELCSLKRHSTNQTPSDYTVAVVSSTTNNSSETPVSSDDGFCGSSDTSDPSIPPGHHRTSYLMTKDGMLNKHSHLTNGTDSTRRVRFNLISKQQEPNLSNHTLRQVEQLYMTRKNILEKQSINSTVV